MKTYIEITADSVVRYRDGLELTPSWPLHPMQYQMVINQAWVVRTWIEATFVHHDRIIIANLRTL